MKIQEIPAFCINLDFRSDRWDLVSKEFKKLNWNLQRISAVEAVYESRSYPNDHNIPAQIRSPAHKACVDSHRNAWKIVSKQDHEVVAIFEDDAMFPSYFQSIFEEAYSELPEDWKIWHLHSFAQEKNHHNLGKYLTKLVSRGMGSHGYLIKKSFSEKLIELSLTTKMAIDTILTTIIQNSKINVYGVRNENALCFQRANDSNIKETAHIANFYYKKINQQFFK